MGLNKEAYFRSDTIQKKAQEMLAEVSGLRDKHADINFQPGKAALLVLDMQRYFIEEDSHAFVPSAEAIIPNIIELVVAFRECKRPIIVTQHINTVEDAGMMAKWWRDLIDPAISRSQLINDINFNNTTQLKKHQYDAFQNTNLEKILKRENIQQIVITGVMTHLCCESTARSAFMRGFEVFFSIDGTATYHEQFHRASLLTLSHGFAVPVLVRELLQSFHQDEH